MKRKLAFLLLAVTLLLNCGISRKEKKIETVPAQPVEEWLNTDEGLVQTGVASWYGDDFHGKRTANGEIYDMDKLTAAHKYLPFHSLVEIENLENRKKVLVRINDRGPFIKNRIIDLSRLAAQRIGMADTGTARVRLRMVKASEVANLLNAEKSEPAPPPPREAVIEKEEIAVSDVRESNPPPSSQSSQSSQTEQNTESYQTSQSSQTTQTTQSSQTTQTIQDSPVIPPTQPTQPIQSIQSISPPVKDEDIETTGDYYLQAGAFGSMKNAKRLMRRIEQLLPNVSFRVEYIDGLYKVLSGSLDSRTTAEKLKRRLAEHDIEAFIREQ